jgi:DNA polymerase-3 subunit gamma/tau
MLSISAFNALLKTLEEPPAHAIFILATTEIYKVPQTIISRCQHFEFHKVLQQDIVKRLSQIAAKEEKKVPKEILESIAYHSEGCIRDSESLLGQILSLGEKEITLEQAELVLPRSRFDLVLELVDFLNKKDSAQAIGLINRLVEDGIDLEKFNFNLIELLRKILLTKINSQLGEFTIGLDEDSQKKVNDLTSRLNLNFLIKSLEIFIKKQQDLKFSDIIQLPLELAVLEIIETDDEQNQPSNTTKATDFKKNDENTEKEPLKREKISEVNKTDAVKPAINISKVKLTIGQVKEKWQEVLICLRKYNHSLASTLKISQPSDIKEDGTLEICLMHKFHQQRINDLKNRQVLEKVLQDIFGIKLIVKTVVVKELPDKNMQIQALAETKISDNPLDNILQTFGGQLVE